MIMLAAFASLRFGEVTALQRQDVDLVARTVTVQRAFSEVRGEGLVSGPPKSRAGIRTLALPDSLVAMLEAHLREWVDTAESALVFTTPTGRPIRRGNFNPMVGWTEIVARAGAAGLHFHDLRHTGNVLAAGSLVSTRDSDGADGSRLNERGADLPACEQDGGSGDRGPPGRPLHVAEASHRQAG